jgi:hypothetical protein
LTIHYFDALAGAGKTRALARHADRLARRGQKVLFTQPTKHLIERTIDGELRPLAPVYPIRAIHGDATSSSVVGEIVTHFQTAVAGGEVVFITHSAFLRLPYIERKSDWVLIMDEAPQVDVYEELTIPDAHHLLTRYLTLEPVGPAYGLLLSREDGQ